MSEPTATHPSSLVPYVSTYAVLLALATVSWLLAGLHMPGAVAIGLSIGAIKALLVLGYFMHLREEPFSFKLAIAVAAALVAIFISLTVLDPVTRSRGADLSAAEGGFGTIHGQNVRGR